MNAGGEKTRFLKNKKPIFGFKLSVNLLQKSEYILTLVIALNLKSNLNFSLI